ncbi:uncharacterized protein LOC108087633 [Drosophila ficusphila]|uniref:uncharacterized protein LOC108087633 n=1 Tax=Drosophila ficusphila TaxID=30025 RepID=UPI0007E84E83|nr:uncharacterized protein LOC108087633 [Drosophila ficusphila]
MKLTVLFIVMQLLSQLAVWANDLPQDQQEMTTSLRQLQKDMAHPWSSPCIRCCLQGKGFLLDSLGECRKVQRPFDCTLYCMFKAHQLH